MFWWDFARIQRYFLKLLYREALPKITEVKCNTPPLPSRQIGSQPGRTEQVNMYKKWRKSAPEPSENQPTMRVNSGQTEECNTEEATIFH